MLINTDLFSLPFVNAERNASKDPQPTFLFLTYIKELAIYPTQSIHHWNFIKNIIESIE